MFCIECQRQGFVKITREVEQDKTKKSIVLCEACWKKFRQGPFRPGHTTSGIEQLSMIHLALKQRRKKINACLVCNTTRAHAVQTGYLGCPVCYEIFSDEVITLLK